VVPAGILPAIFAHSIVVFEIYLMLMYKLFIATILIAGFSRITIGDDASIQNLSNLEELRQTFQKDAGKVRIIALLSPT
jgi:hypothetical protein